MSVSRRMFLNRVARAGGYGALFVTMQGLGLLAAAPAYAGPPPLPRGEGRKVLVLGAGIVGLVAAYELRKAGYDVTVLEALGRPGGRVWTLRRGDRVRQIGRADQVVDWQAGRNSYLNAGAARIPQTHHAILSYCRELKVPLEVMVNGNRTAKVDFGGKVVTNGQALNDTRGAFAELLAKAIDKGALDAELTGADKQRLLGYLSAYGDLNPARVYTGARGRSGFRVPPGGYEHPPVGVDPLRLADLTQARFWGVSAYFEELLEMQATMLQPVGGMDRIAHALFEAVAPSVTFGAEVLELRRDGAGARVVYRQRGTVRTHSAQHVLVTLPLTVLAKLPNDFRPEVKSAIASAHYEVGTKVGWETRRFWEQDDFQFGGLSWTDTLPEVVWYPSGGLGDAKGILVGAYSLGFTGPEAPERFAALSFEERFALSRTLIDRLHPGRGKELTKPITVAWSQTAFAEGVAVVWRPEQRAHEYAQLCRPDGPFVFAGEHLSYLNAWQEGAILSAHEAIAAIGRQVVA